MEKIFFKVFVVVILSFFAVVSSFPWTSFGINGVPFSAGEYKLGLDLAGGVELDYKLELDEVRKEEGYTNQKEQSIVEGLKSIVDKRIEALKISDSVITTADYSGEKHIIVQIPLKASKQEENNANIERAKQAIGKVVKIEFKEKRVEVKQEDIIARKDLAKKALQESKDSVYPFGVTAKKYMDNNENIQEGTMSGTTNELKGFFDTSRITKIGLQDEVITGTGMANFAMGADGQLSQTSGDKSYWVLNVKNIEELTNSGSKEKKYDFDYILVGANPSEWIAAKDSKGRVLNDKYFIKAAVSHNQAFQPQVELNFNDEGAQIFGELTTRLSGKQIAIFVGGQLLTAPNVNEPIKSGQAVITGRYTFEEANKLANDINTGVIPAPIYLVSERTIDAKLGADSMNKLILAGIIGFVIIFLFLISVYRSAGFLRAIALVIYTAILLALVKIFGVVLTLASIAGLILSIGMAIDANVLIFERIREELRNKIPMIKAVQVGFDKSWTAIWDSNLTGLIVALILYIFGINMIKGFGLMLGLGIVVSMFSAMWISRIFVLALAKKCSDMKMSTFIGGVK